MQEIIILEDYTTVPSSTREAQGERSLLTICLDVHMATTGSSDPYEEYERDIALLSQADRDWKEGDPDSLWTPFDNAVRNLIRVTVAETERAKR